MSEPKNPGGRPKYTPEERKAASDSSFVNALTQFEDTDCWTVKADHMIGYDGNRVRTRTFAWNFYHPDEPASGGELVKICATPKCVAEAHLRLKIAHNIYQPHAVPKPPSPIDPVIEKGFIGQATHKWDMETQARGVASLKSYWKDRPVSFESDEAETMRRVDIIREVAAGGNEELALTMVGPQWGIIE